MLTLFLTFFSPQEQSQQENTGALAHLTHKGKTLSVSLTESWRLVWKPCELLPKWWQEWVPPDIHHPETFAHQQVWQQPWRYRVSISREAGGLHLHSQQLLIFRLQCQHQQCQQHCPVSLPQPTQLPQHCQYGGRPRDPLVAHHMCAGGSLETPSQKVSFPAEREPREEVLNVGRCMQTPECCCPSKVTPRHCPACSLDWAFWFSTCATAHSATEMHQLPTAKHEHSEWTTHLISLGFIRKEAFVR